LAERAVDWAVRAEFPSPAECRLPILEVFLPPLPLRFRDVWRGGFPVECLSPAEMAVSMHYPANVPVEWRDVDSESREDRVWLKECSGEWRERWVLPRESMDAESDD
jgi:hypothetical protein